MMKKITTCFLVMVIAVGCAQAPVEADRPEEPPVVEQPQKPVEQEKPKEETKVKKIDDSKDWVYVESIVEIGEAAFNLSVDNTKAYEDETEKWLNTFSNNNYCIETLSINIDSEDAITINEELAKIAYDTLHTKAAGVKALTEGKWFVSDNVLSVVLKRTGLGSHSFRNFQVFNFDLFSGELLTNDRLLGLINVEDIQAKIDQVLISINSDVCSEDNVENCHFNEDVGGILFNSIYKDSSAIFMNESGNLNYLIELNTYRERGGDKESYFYIKPLKLDIKH